MMIAFRLLPPAVVALGFVLLAYPPTARAGAGPAERARTFVKDHEAKVRPLEIAANLAWWNANTTGKSEDFARKIEAQNRIDEALSDPKTFAGLKEIKEHRKEID